MIFSADGMVPRTWSRRFSPFLILSLEFLVFRGFLILSLQRGGMPNVPSAQ
jgi:hypothetical protein